MMKPPPTEHQVSSARTSPCPSRAQKRKVLGWRFGVLTKSKMMSASGSKAISLEPASARIWLVFTAATIASTSAGWIVAGAPPGGRRKARLVARMALAGEGERAIERNFDRGRAADRAACPEAMGESRRRFHRPHRMRGRGADADLEQFEDADHPPSP